MASLLHSPIQKYLHTYASVLYSKGEVTTSNLSSRPPPLFSFVVLSLISIAMDTIFRLGEGAAATVGLSLLPFVRRAVETLP